MIPFAEQVIGNLLRPLLTLPCLSGLVTLLGLLGRVCALPPPLALVVKPPAQATERLIQPNSTLIRRVCRCIRRIYSRSQIAPLRRHARCYRQPPLAGAQAKGGLSAARLPGTRGTGVTEKYPRASDPGASRAVIVSAAASHRRTP
jgi:hypothetical protein